MTQEPLLGFLDLDKAYDGLPWVHQYVTSYWLLRSWITIFDDLRVGFIG